MSIDNPRVSVGMPVYNGERFVEEAIRSILEQTYADFELVICDNASTDRTESICRAYAAADPRIRYFRNPENIGAAGNVRRVFELSRAPYFRWAFHDDLSGKTFLEQCVSVLDKSPNVVLCHPRCAFIDERGRVLVEHDIYCDLRSRRASERVWQYLLYSTDSLTPVFGVTRRAALEKTRLLAPYINSDMVLILQLALLGEVSELPDRLFLCREHADRSCRRYATYSDLVAWHDPANRGRRKFPRWRVVLEIVRSIYRTPLGVRETAACSWAVLRWCRWHWRHLILELLKPPQRFERAAASNDHASSVAPVANR